MRVQYSKKVIGDFLGSLSLTLMGLGSLSQDGDQSTFLKNYLSFWFKQKTAVVYKKSLLSKKENKSVIFFFCKKCKQPVCMNKSRFLISKSKLKNQTLTALTYPKK